MRKFIFALAVMVVGSTLAQVTPAVMSIAYQATNSTVSLQVSSISTQTVALVIQTSTNLLSTNWGTYTNLGPNQMVPLPAGSVLVFTNIPATNSQMFFRCKSY